MRYRDSTIFTELFTILACAVIAVFFIVTSHRLSIKNQKLITENSDLYTAHICDSISYLKYKDSVENRVRNERAAKLAVSVRKLWNMIPDKNKTPELKAHKRGFAVRK